MVLPSALVWDVEPDVVDVDPPEPLVYEPVADVDVVPSASVYVEEPEPCVAEPAEPLVTEPVAEVDVLPPAASVNVVEPEVVVEAPWAPLSAVPLPDNSIAPSDPDTINEPVIATDPSDPDIPAEVITILPITLQSPLIRICTTFLFFDSLYSNSLLPRQSTNRLYHYLNEGHQL